MRAKRIKNRQERNAKFAKENEESLEMMKEKMKLPREEQEASSPVYEDATREKAEGEWVKKYLSANKNLPEIPSVKEIMEMDLAETFLNEMQNIK